MPNVSISKELHEAIKTKIKSLPHHTVRSYIETTLLNRLDGESKPGIKKPPAKDDNMYM